jgi:hypothetical protein
MRILTISMVGTVLLYALPSASACDVCGCSGAGSSPGLLPLVQRHFVGLRWQSQDYSLLAHHEGNSPVYETFQTTDIMGRWQPQRRLQVIGTMPYFTASRTVPGAPVLRAEGIGDATVLFQYSLADPARQMTGKWQYALQAGAGVKLPTGRSNLADAEGTAIPPNMQPGTGSTDFLTTMLCAIRRGKAGISLDAAMRLTTANSSGYRFGHRLNTGIQGFYVMSLGKTSLIPSLGVAMDARQADRMNARIKGETGGYAISSVLSVQYFRGNIALNLNGWLPLYNNMGDGLITPGFQWGAGIAVLFGNKINKVPQGIFKDVNGVNTPVNTE